MKVKNTFIITTLAAALVATASSARAADLTWDSNLTGTDQTDGGGTWLTTDQWWNGANTTWANGTPDNAFIGNGGNGGTITLGSVIAGTVTLTNFTGTYTLSGGDLTTSGGVILGADAGHATLTTAVGGSGGITKNSPGKLILSNEGSSYAGPTVVNGGILQLGTGWSNADSIPGGVGVTSGGSNLELNNGTVTICYYLRRTLGSGPGEIQFTGGHAGINHWQGDTYGSVTISNSANFELVWGSPYFKPDVFVLNAADSNPQQIVNIKNKIDLNGETRTVACHSTASVAPYISANNGFMDTAGGRLAGVIRNSSATPAGLIKTGVGWLQLPAANTYDGDTSVLEGTLDISASSTLSDVAVLRITAGATVNLRTGVDETVLTSYYDDDPLDAGTWGSSASAATNVDDTIFSGDGILTVLQAGHRDGMVIILY